MIEEFFKGYYDVWQAIGMPSANSIGSVVGILSVAFAVVCGSAVLYIAGGEVIKAIRRKFSQRLNPIISVTLRHKKGKRQ